MEKIKESTLRRITITHESASSWELSLTITEGEGTVDIRTEKPYGASLTYKELDDLFSWYLKNK
jgi:hypothetical protein